MFARLDAFARRVYLAVLCATAYPEQEPAHAAARWYHLLWFLLPIAGFIGFIAQVEHTYNRTLV